MPMEFSEAFDIRRAIEHGVQTLQRAPVTMVLGGFLMMLVECGSGAGSNGNGIPSDMGSMSEGEAAAIAMVVLAAVGCGCCLQIAGWLAKSFIMPGYLRSLRDAVMHGTDEAGNIFKGGDAFVNMALWLLLAGCINIGVFMVAFLPGGALMGIGIWQDMMPLTIIGTLVGLVIALPVGIYVSLGVMLGTFAIAIDDCKPLEALEKSWTLASGNRLTLFVFAIAIGVVNLLGIMACCVGTFATVPITQVALLESYMLATREGWESWDSFQAGPAA